MGESGSTCCASAGSCPSLRAADDPQEIARTVWRSQSWVVVSSVARQLVHARVDCGYVAHITEATRGPSARRRGPVQVSSRGVRQPRVGGWRSIAGRRPVSVAVNAGRLHCGRTVSLWDQTAHGQLLNPISGEGRSGRGVGPFHMR